MSKSCHWHRGEYLCLFAGGGSFNSQRSMIRPRIPVQSSSLEGLMQSVNRVCIRIESINSRPHQATFMSEAILSNFVLYLSHGARNYIEFWQVKSLPFALKFQGAILPSFEDQLLQNVVKYLYKSSYSDNLSILFISLSISLGFCSNFLFK